MREWANGAPTAFQILEEGRCCWRIVPAARFAFMIDAADYFAALREALGRARQRIMILGWDLDASIRLDPNDPASELRHILPGLVEERPELEILILIWETSVVFGPSRTLAPWFEDWHEHPRIRFHYDDHHPTGAAHHEKIVCIDDALAFAGGIDLTLARWDTSEHLAERPERRNPDGKLYPPVHDLQAALDGPAAAAVAALARERWRLATGDDLSPVAATEDPWPPALEPSLHNVQVGIARTRPQCGAQAAASEVARLNEAALSGARRFIYLETQYLTAGGVGDILIRQLERPDGPEIVIVAWRSTEGWIERFVMGANRDRLIRRLLRADRYGRLRVYWLAAPGDGIEIGLHAKLMLVDDLFVRIGSSNLNNRSLGLDTECDLAIEARDATTSAAIAALRSRLLAEHLGVAPGEVEAAVARHGLIGGVDRLGGPASRLRPFEVAPDAETEPIAGTLLLDPLEPIDLDYLRRLFW